MLESASEARIGQALFTSDADKLFLEQRNAYRLAKAVDRLARLMIRGDRKITSGIICRFQRFAIRDIYSCAGRFRTWPITITGSVHKPPRDGVAGLVESMCEYVDEKVEAAEWDAIQVAAYFLWRINWIHPFGGGNGRVSRAIAYLAICVHLGEVPEGKLSIAEQIDQDRNRYQAALEDADMAWKESQIVDVSQLTKLLDEYLRNQIISAN
jgi:Fic family protein